MLSDIDDLRQLRYQNVLFEGQLKRYITFAHQIC